MKFFCQGNREKKLVKTKIESKGSKNKERGYSMLFLVLRHFTWFPILGRAMQTIIPFTHDDEEVFIHTLIGIKNTGNQPNNGNPIPKIVTCFFPLLAIVNPIHIIPSEVGLYFLVSISMLPSTLKRLGEH